MIANTNDFQNARHALFTQRFIELLEHRVQEAKLEGYDQAEVLFVADEGGYHAPPSSWGLWFYNLFGWKLEEEQQAILWAEDIIRRFGFTAIRGWMYGGAMLGDNGWVIVASWNGTRIDKTGMKVYPRGRYQQLPYLLDSP